MKKLNVTFQKKVKWLKMFDTNSNAQSLYYFNTTNL